jgi:predicted phosphoribosyltransferase
MFANRFAAGSALGRAVAAHKWPHPVLVLGLPRGGVPVAYEVAKALAAPLDLMIVRKIGMPGQPEYAIGAVALGDVTVRDRAGLATSDEEFERLATRERAELRRREQAYRRGAPPLDLGGKTVILVDDGIATGATMLAAVRATRRAGAAKVIVATPVASVEAAATLREEADEVVCLQRPAFFMSIGEWYEEFDQLEDAEVCAILEAARDAQGPPASTPDGRRSKHTGVRGN